MTYIYAVKLFKMFFFMLSVIIIMHSVSVDLFSLYVFIYLESLNSSLLCFRIWPKTGNPHQAQLKIEG